MVNTLRWNSVYTADCILDSVTTPLQFGLHDFRPRRHSGRLGNSAMAGREGGLPFSLQDLLTYDHWGEQQDLICRVAPIKEEPAHTEGSCQDQLATDHYLSVRSLFLELVDRSPLAPHVEFYIEGLRYRQRFQHDQSRSAVRDEFLRLYTCFFRDNEDLTFEDRCGFHSLQLYLIVCKYSTRTTTPRGKPGHSEDCRHHVSL